MWKPEKSNDRLKLRANLHKFAPFSPLWVPGPARTFSFGEENVRCAHLFFSKGKCFLQGSPPSGGWEKHFPLEKKRWESSAGVPFNTSNVYCKYNWHVGLWWTVTLSENSNLLHYFGPSSLNFALKYIYVYIFWKILSRRIDWCHLYFNQSPVAPSIGLQMSKIAKFC